jgi:hypothetical protein
VSEQQEQAYAGWRDQYDDEPTLRQAFIAGWGASVQPPRPSAEPMVPLRAVVAVMDHYDNGDNECEPEDRWRLFRDMRSLLASGQVIRPEPHTHDMGEPDQWHVTRCSVCGLAASVEFIREQTPFPKETPSAEPVSIADIEQGVLDQIKASRSAPLAPALQPNPGWNKRRDVTPPEETS